ncbi:unnamed protein product [Miscanthus lutarioriparius]|uniref:Uncharacterized protein n=1 Tax=Miscanthus lutarioriparius TaxID=422564 RepID=A0A811QIB6_9POAL|nr:unnamed protein product [Miscanthus lutarioriparius]
MGKRIAVRKMSTTRTTYLHPNLLGKESEGSRRQQPGTQGTVEAEMATDLVVEKASTLGASTHPRLEETSSPGTEEQPPVTEAAGDKMCPPSKKKKVLKPEGSVSPKDACHKAKLIREGADRDLLQALKTTRQQEENLAAVKTELKDLQEAVESTLDLIPEEEDGEASLLERAKIAPGRLMQYVKDMAKAIVKSLLGILHAHMPRAELTVILKRPEGCTNKELAAAEGRIDDLATSYAGSLDLEG